MINHIYQLINPGIISAKYDDISLDEGVIIRPEYMAVCHADQRYYMGKRDAKILKKKLPMALIHECSGEVAFDSTKTYTAGQKVVLIPNVPSGISASEMYENYGKNVKFLSSGHDGFMREFVNLPADRVVPFNNISSSLASISEFVSVAVHAANRFSKCSHALRNKIGIWGDGSLSFVLANVLKETFPDSKIAVIGKNRSKLMQFIFVDETHTADNIPHDFEVDHAFECAGGEGSYYAIDDIIRYINPQGSVMLMGVSENKIAVNTRDILEKGLTFVGSSRSGREDFVKAIKIMEISKVQKRLGSIIHEDKKVRSIKDIHRVFATDLNTPFKTVFKWDM
ncbi:MAG: alcohol dehydrogenase catalytic domain-containing protein [Oscillospiraceae bacterium]|nr:alcohol dehydrogenase catalytic domain-containing protein [Oscillospiraceae bacterium]